MIGKKFIISALRKAGYQINSIHPSVKDYEEEFIDIYHKCKDYTMTSPKRMYALYNAVKYIVQNNIEGDIVECGVWRGGSAMVIAYTLELLGDRSRDLFLYDTYEGMTPPTSEDVDYSGNSADVLLKSANKSKGTAKESIWCIADLDDVKSNLAKTKYPENKLHYIQGKVEDTLTQAAKTDKISLLRLDTDWYESTKIEMEKLFPSLVLHGVLIIDDYGHWKGSQRAVDDYFLQHDLHYLIHRIDYSGVSLIKTSS